MNEMSPLAVGVAGRPVRHDSAEKHVAGTALYVDDLAEPAGLLHAFAALSVHAHARLTLLDTVAVVNAPGVAAVLLARDIPGVNDCGPAGPGDPILAEGLVEYHGQALFAVAATSIAAAARAARLAVVEYAPLPAVLTVDAAMDQGLFVLPSQTMARGDAPAAIAAAPHRLAGRVRVGGQEHFYLEGQVAMAVPGEDDDLVVHSSTQHPTEVQHLVARCLGRRDHAVTVETRRMGGAFGGKESQASQIACIAALLAVQTGRPVKLRLDRDDDMRLTGKRHDFRIDYEVGFGDDGVLHGARFELASRCGYSPDLSAAINDRAMLHADNAYYLPAALIVSHRCKTHTVSNTAFRGFGGPQGMFAIEHALDAVARHLKLDPLVVRTRNLYGPGRDVTPYGMTIEDNVAPEIVAELRANSGYDARRAAISTFNATSQLKKRGIALTPVKFGISFTAIHLNQAGALVNVYTDGSVSLNHGGTEMGQGLFTKVAQVVAATFALPLDAVRITATSTAKVPNTSPTAASSGSDLNGMAAANAARAIRDRIAATVARAADVEAETIVFADGRVHVAGQSMSFAQAVRAAYMARVQLSAAGFYATPKIHYDRASHTGRPFFYFAYGASCSEVEIDVLTGEYAVLRTDILHDAGRSLNPALDIGQIEGGFVQGMGWLTTEELSWDAAGRLRTHAPSTYKIPTAGDVPPDFRVALWRAGVNREDTIMRSKAVGEPPLMHGLSVFHALRDAIAAAGGNPDIDAPATPERVLMALPG